MNVSEHSSTAHSTLKVILWVEITMAQHSSTTATILKLHLEDTSWRCRLHDNHNGEAQFNHWNDLEVTSWRYILKIHLEGVVCMIITMAKHSSTTVTILKLHLENTSWSCRLHENHNGEAQFNHCNDPEITSWRYILKLSSAWKSQWRSTVQPLQWSWNYILKIHLEVDVCMKITMAKHSSTTAMILKLHLEDTSWSCRLHENHNGEAQFNHCNDPEVTVARCRDIAHSLWSLPAHGLLSIPCA